MNALQRVGLKMLNIKREDVLKNVVYRSLFKFLGTGSPIYIPNENKNFITDGYKMNPDVYAVINLIAKRCAGIQWNLYKVKNEKALYHYKSISTDADGFLFNRILYRHKALDLIVNHPILEVLKKPNPHNKWNHFIYNNVGYKLLLGNSYVWGKGPKAGGENQGKIQQLYNVPAPVVEIIAGTWQQPIQNYKVKYTYEDYDLIPPEEVMHRKYWNPEVDFQGSQLYGMSPLEPLVRTITASNDKNTAMVKLLQNVGAIGVLASGDDADVFPPEAGVAIQDRYKKIVGGTGPHRYGEMIITSANVKWHQIGMNAVDLALFELGLATKRDICQVYAVDPILLGGDPDSSSYNNKREARKALINDAVVPELDDLRDELNDFFVKGYGEDLYLDYDITSIPELQEDLEKLKNILKECWWIKAIDKQRMMGFDEDPLMDKYFIPSNIIPYDGTEPDLDMDEEKLLRIADKEYGQNE